MNRRNFMKQVAGAAAALGTGTLATGKETAQVDIANACFPSAADMLNAEDPWLENIRHQMDIRIFRPMWENLAGEVGISPFVFVKESREVKHTPA